MTGRTVIGPTEIGPVVSVTAGNSVARTVIAPVATLPAFTVTARGGTMIDPQVTAGSGRTRTVRGETVTGRTVIDHVEIRATALPTPAAAKSGLIVTTTNRWRAARDAEIARQNTFRRITTRIGRKKVSGMTAAPGIKNGSMPATRDRPGDRATGPVRARSPERRQPQVRRDRSSESRPWAGQARNTVTRPRRGSAAI